MTLHSSTFAHHYPALPQPEQRPDPAQRRKLRVCIASPDFVGVVNNGGIGTVYTAMAEGLSEAGHEVVCLYTYGEMVASHSIEHWIQQYRKRKITLVPLPSAGLDLTTTEHATKSYETYLWLKHHDYFDVIHFPEWKGTGYYTQVAKNQGLAFGTTTICVGIHSMTVWLKAGASEHLDKLDDLQLDFMEQQTVALADVLWSPSQYLLNWIVDRGWTIPAAAYVQQYITPRSSRTTRQSPATAKIRMVDELVFFGRLETRKGIRLFCDTLDRLAAEPEGSLKKVTFLGKEALVDGTPATKFLAERSKGWPWTVDILSDRNQYQAIEYLRGGGRLAIIASQLENSPLTVYECLGAGIAFLANGLGGIPELIAEKDVDSVCFLNRVDSLAEKIGDALRNGVRLASPAIKADETERAWLAWHELQFGKNRAKATVLPEAWPKVSLCITTFNRPVLLRQALESVRAISYPKLEVVLVDDGSSQAEALALLDELAHEFTQRGWQIVRQTNRYLGAARNTAAKHATGEFLLFMDDDNCAESHEVTMLVRAILTSDADIMCPGMKYFSGHEAPSPGSIPKRVYLPLGASVSAGAFSNCFGDANALVRRSCFEQVGGFTTDYGVTHEDWEFHARAVLKGFKLQVIPEFLFWYRVSPDSMLRTTAAYRNQMRSIRPYLDAVPPALHNLILFATGSAFQSAKPGGSPAWVSASYAKLTILWRSKMEAGRELAKLDLPQDAARVMLEGLKAVESCKQPTIILDALLGICEHLATLDPNRAHYLLNIAANLAKKFNRAKDQEVAQTMLAALDQTRGARITKPRN